MIDFTSIVSTNLTGYLTGMDKNKLSAQSIDNTFKEIFGLKAQEIDTLCNEKVSSCEFFDDNKQITNMPRTDPNNIILPDKTAEFKLKKEALIKDNQKKLNRLKACSIMLSALGVVACKASFVLGIAIGLSTIANYKYKSEEYEKNLELNLKKITEDFEKSNVGKPAAETHHNKFLNFDNATDKP